VSVLAEASELGRADDTVSMISPTAPSKSVGELDHIGLALLGGAQFAGLLVEVFKKNARSSNA